jgi:hypothetical protein
MAGNAGNSGSGGDSGLILVIILIVVGPFLAWFILQKPVVFLWSWISYGQTWMLAHVEGIFQHQSVMAEMAANAPLMHWLLWAHAHPSKISWHDVAHYSTILGSYYRWLVIPLVAWLAWKNYTAVELRKARQSMNDAVISLKNRYPWGLPWLWQKSGILTKTGSGPFRLALRPWEWVHSLEKTGKTLVYKELPDSPETIVLSDPEPLREALATQLAHPMDDYAHWPIWFQALTTACIPQARDGKDTESFARMARLARHYFGVQPKAGADYVPPALKKVPWPVTEADLAYLRTVAERHGFRETLFLGLLAQARLRGLLPPAYFTWLRAVDRGLWYAAQSLGRPRYFMEGAGIMAHYLAEQRQTTAAEGDGDDSFLEQDSLATLEARYGDHASRLTTPQVDSALAGLVFALREEDAAPAQKVAEAAQFPKEWTA